MAKFKVFNNNNFRVGIRYEDQSNREQTIQPKTAIMMDEQDILYVDAVSQLFRQGVIYVEDQDMLETMGYVEKSPNTISEEELGKIFKMSVGKIKAELSKLDAKHAFDKVISVARSTDDLSQAKLKVIAGAIGVEVEELMQGEVS